MAKSNGKSTTAQGSATKRRSKQMAKQKHKHEDAEGGEVHEQASHQHLEPASPQTITVDGVQFSIPSPYAHGHVLTENEAGALNQLFAENIRNNFSKKVKGAKEAHKTETGSEDLSPDVIEGLQRDIEAYANQYQFGKRAPGAGGGVKKDPVLREAEKIAKATLDAKLNEKKIAKKSLAEGRYEELVKTLLDRDPSIMEEARRRVAQLKEVAATSVEDLLGLGEAA